MQNVLPVFGWEDSASESLPPPGGTCSILLLIRGSSSVLSVAIVRWIFWYLEFGKGQEEETTLVSSMFETETFQQHFDILHFKVKLIICI